MKVYEICFDKIDVSPANNGRTTRMHVDGQFYTTGYTRSECLSEYLDTEHKQLIEDNTDRLRKYKAYEPDLLNSMYGRMRIRESASVSAILRVANAIGLDIRIID